MDNNSEQLSAVTGKPQDIAITDYTYSLPPERIAEAPLPERDASKLLVYRNGSITESVYRQIHEHLPAGCLLVFNNTKVINARVLFTKATGGLVEIFCLEPAEAVNEYTTVMNQTGSAAWKCMIGGASKWKEGPLSRQLQLGQETVTLDVRLEEKLPDACRVRFSWQPAHHSFAAIIQAAGEVPLPPYIKRSATAADADRYQTIYAQHDGSVAAPTAGLHFTERVFEQLGQKNINHSFITLHVGAGTFKPVKAATMQEHQMHAEWIDVSAAVIENLAQRTEDGIVAVGTTSLRTLESVYWMGVKAALNPECASLELHQWDVYEAPLAHAQFTPAEALAALLAWMEARQLHSLFTQTQLLIAPGYRFRMVKAIVTNFHQPQSTLLLLVAAAVGPQWRSIYDYALANQFRFLSYGDGSLLYIGT